MSGHDMLHKLTWFQNTFIINFLSPEPQYCIISQHLQVVSGALPRALPGPHDSFTVPIFHANCQRESPLRYFLCP